MQNSALSAKCPRYVRADILRRPAGIRAPSAMCPQSVRSTRPDPTRPDPFFIPRPGLCTWSILLALHQKADAREDAMQERTQ